MAAYTSTGSGNWSATGTWTPSGVPGNGDTATIASGHTVTVDVDSIIGTSPAAGNTVLTLTGSTSVLSIAAGVTLTLRGDAVIQGANLVSSVQMTLAAGSRLLFDSSVAASPSATAYRLSIGNASDNHSRLQCRGTPASPCVITSATANSAASGFISDGGNPGGGNIDAEWTNFSRLGSASQSAIVFGGARDLSYLRLSDCTIDDCGQLSTTYNVGTGATFILQNVRTTNERGTYSVNFLSVSTSVTGTRVVRGCSLGKQARFVSPEGFLFEDTLLRAAIDSTACNVAATVRRCLIRDPNQGAWNIHNSLTDCYLLEDHTDTNPHGYNLLSNRDIVTDGCIWEWTGTATGDGDLFIHASNPSSPRSHTCRRCIVLPGASGNNNIGKLISLLGGTNTSIAAADNNTVFAQSGLDSGVVSYGETYAGYTGMVASVRSNVVWNQPGAGGGYKILQTNQTGTPTDVVSNANFNCGWNLAAGSEGKGYHKRSMTAAMFTATTPGVNDIDVNPIFRDSTRNLARWGASRGADGTVAGALAVIASNPYLISSLVAWVRAGFEPLNRRLHNAGHNGSTIGAVPFTPINRRTRRRAG